MLAAEAWLSPGGICEGVAFSAATSHERGFLGLAPPTLPINPRQGLAPGGGGLPFSGKSRIVKEHPPFPPDVSLVCFPLAEIPFSRSPYHRGRVSPTIAPWRCHYRLKAILWCQRLIADSDSFPDTYFGRQQADHLVFGSAAHSGPRAPAIRGGGESPG